MSPIPCTAQMVIDPVPLGALVRFADGQPRPPARFKRKLSAWEQRNGMGRLTEKAANRAGRQGHFTLHLGDFGSDALVILSIRRVFNADSRSTFVVERVPAPGEALVLTDFMGRDELQHLAPNEAAARAWLEAQRHPNARIKIVTDRVCTAAAA